IEADALVPGDIVRLRSGDRVPADLRPIEANTLRAGESALPAESEPPPKSTAAPPADAAVGARPGMPTPAPPAPPAPGAAALTGESEPASKSTDASPADAGVGDRHGMAYSGSLVAAGRGVGVVTGTGPTTELGRINQMIADVEQLATPLTRQMAAFGKVLSI